MKGPRGKILYVGKAKNLRARLGSYFRGDAGHTVKTAALVARVEAVEVLLTASEKEALLLESSLIKKYRPRYNVVLKDDKNYILFKLDKRSPFPRLAFTRRVARDGAAYFGPFTSAAAARATWKELGRVFPLRKCGDRAMANRVRPCLYHFIGQCLAPCVKAVDADAYMELVRRVEAFLTGRSAEVIKNVEKEMAEAAEALAFEKAAGLRDLLRAMRRTVEGQATVLTRLVDMDVVGFAATAQGVGLCILFVRQGRLLDRKTFFFPGLEAGEAVWAAGSALTQFYRPESFIPPRVVVPEALAPEAVGEAAGAAASPDEPGGEGQGDAQALAEILEERRGAAVRFGAPRGREERKLLALAEVNARRAAEEAAKAAERDVLPALAAKAPPPAWARSGAACAWASSFSRTARRRSATTAPTPFPSWKARPTTTWRWRPLRPSAPPPVRPGRSCSSSTAARASSRPFPGPSPRPARAEPSLWPPSPRATRAPKTRCTTWCMCLAARIRWRCGLGRRSSFSCNACATRCTNFPSAASAGPGTRPVWPATCWPCRAWGPRRRSCCGSLAAMKAAGIAEIASRTGLGQKRAVSIATALSQLPD